jgi:hypothetical protein
MIGALVRIKPQYRDAGEPDTLYRVLTEPNAMGRVEIVPVKHDWTFPPVELIGVNMIEESE